MYEALVARVRYHIQKASFMGLKDAESTLLLAEAADAIEELTDRNVGKWIPVTERLPEKHEWVLVRSKLVKMRTDIIGNDGNWYTTPAVTHWMPLPEPPKEET